jgi:2Fe-2S ferredoxin
LPNVVYVTGDGAPHIVTAEVGDTVMNTALRNGIPGIIGECGGFKSCATCHVIVRPDFAELVGGPIDDLEEDLLDLGVTDRQPTSRLGCQIVLTESLDGVTVDVPAHQN